MKLSIWKTFKRPLRVRGGSANCSAVQFRARAFPVNVNLRKEGDFMKKVHVTIGFYPSPYYPIEARFMLCNVGYHLVFSDIAECKRYFNFRFYGNVAFHEKKNML